jgi:drug/metabolite transporter (DMT)-like permease
VSFERLNRWDWVALVAALALLFTMGVDWYSTPQGDEARRIERIEDPSDLPSGQIGREVEERAAERAEGAERNAVQPEAFIDGVLLVLLFATVAFVAVAAFARAAGRRFEPPATPSAAAAFTAAFAALMVAYRIVQQPGLDEGTTIKSGAWLSLVVLGVIAIASSRALDLEEEGRAFRTTEAKPA